MGVGVLAAGGRWALCAGRGQCLYPAWAKQLQMPRTARDVLHAASPRHAHGACTVLGCARGVWGHCPLGVDATACGLHTLS